MFSIIKTLIGKSRTCGKAEIILALLFCIVIINGCSYRIFDKTKAIYSDNLNDDNSGIIIGRVTLQVTKYYVSESKGIGFAKCETKKRTVYVGGHYFFLRLPVGCFEFESIGGPDGAYEAIDEPFRFTVYRGEINYIGSFVSGIELKHLDTIELIRPVAETEILGSKKYGVPRLFQKVSKYPIDFYVIDERERVVQEFHKKFPEFMNRKILFDFMK